MFYLVRRGMSQKKTISLKICFAQYLCYNAIFFFYLWANAKLYTCVMMMMREFLPN